MATDAHRCTQIRKGWVNVFVSRILRGSRTCGGRWIRGKRRGFFSGCSRAGRGRGVRRRDRAAGAGCAVFYPWGLLLSRYGGLEVALALGCGGDFLTRKKGAIWGGCCGSLVGQVLQILESGEDDFFAFVDFVVAAALGLEFAEGLAVAMEAAGHAAVRRGS